MFQMAGGEAQSTKPERVDLLKQVISFHEAKYPRITT